VRLRPGRISVVASIGRARVGLRERVPDGLTQGPGHGRREGVADLPVRIGLPSRELPRVREALQPGYHPDGQLGPLAGREQRPTDAQALITAAAAGRTKEADARAGAATPATGTGPWRVRALNAESELEHAHHEITAQRGRIGEPLGRIRDLEHDLPEDGVARTITENHALRAQVRQLTQDNRRLEGLRP
jgi:hypothetical protein